MQDHAEGMLSSDPAYAVAFVTHGIVDLQEYFNYAVERHPKVAVANAPYPSPAVTGDKDPKSTAGESDGDSRDDSSDDMSISDEATPSRVMPTTEELRPKFRQLGPDLGRKYVLESVGGRAGGDLCRVFETGLDTSSPVAPERDILHDLEPISCPFDRGEWSVARVTMLRDRFFQNLLQFTNSAGKPEDLTQTQRI